MSKKYHRRNNNDGIEGIVTFLIFIGLSLFFKYYIYILIVLGIIGVYFLVRFIIDMDFFSDFKKPYLYYNGDSNLKRLKKLEQDSLNGIDNGFKISCLKRGIYGENRLLYVLNNCQIPMYILHDLNLSFDEYKSQIDFIIITKRSIYVLESKNLSGNLDIEKDCSFTRKFGKYKKGIKNPLTQNFEHENVLNSILKKEKIRRRYNSLVVLTNDDSYINFKGYSKEKYLNIMRNDQLGKFLKNFEKKAHICRNEKKIKLIADSILKYNVAIEYEIKDDVLINNLKQWRVNMSFIDGVEPYMIFNDMTLSELVKKKPKDLIELSKIYGFGDYKAKKYGEEVLNIINKV